jgi:hypothetical protein
MILGLIVLVAFYLLINHAVVRTGAVVAAAVN